MSKKPTKRGLTTSPLASYLLGPIADSIVKGQRFKRAESIIRGHKEGLNPPAPLKFPDTAPGACPCKNFKMADWRWRVLTAAQKATWNAAVKKPFMSGYELFMKENLTTLKSKGKYCDVPSPSGGFSCALVVGGAIPPNAWIGMYTAPPPPPPVNACNLCSPKISDTLRVVIPTQAGDFINCSGTYDLTWATLCIWQKVFLAPDPRAPATMTTEWLGTPDFDWRFQLLKPNTSCMKRWRKGANTPCAPQGTYALVVCQDSGCGNPNTCALSGTASVTISQV
jgi:hypothetical protein